jgi:hypothetical protein
MPSVGLGIRSTAAGPREDEDRLGSLLWSIDQRT